MNELIINPNFDKPMRINKNIKISHINLIMFSMTEGIILRKRHGRNEKQAIIDQTC